MRPYLILAGLKAATKTALYLFQTILLSIGRLNLKEFIHRVKPFETGKYLDRLQIIIMTPFNKCIKLKLFIRKGRLVDREINAQ